MRSALTPLLLVACSVVSTIAFAPPALAVQEQGAPATEDAVPETDPPPQLDRPMTRTELEREIEITRRSMEEAVTRMRGKVPSDEQLANLDKLSNRLEELRRQLEARKAETEQKIEKEDDSFLARWGRLRVALTDFTKYETHNGLFRIHFGVRFQLDATAGDASDSLAATRGDIDESFDFRRVRIFSDGRLFRTIDFRFEYDFATDAGFKDAYLEGAKYTKYFKWRIGHFKEPFSLSRHTSANHLSFMEWPLPVQAFAPGRNWGIMARHSAATQRMTWALALTTSGRTTDDNRGASNITITARATGLPLYRDEGRKLVHLGLSLSRRDPSGGTVAFGARPEARFTPFFVDTGDIAADSNDLYGLEFATVQGRWWVQAELIRAPLQSTETGDPVFGGAYAEAGWFLTGESRMYLTHEGVFGRLTPNRRFQGGNPFKKDRDGGALEVVGRYSVVDLNDGVVRGGEMRDVSLGITWYLTQSSRIMANYIHSNVKDVGRANLVLLRYQFNP